jgi:hypothetical protein
MKAILTRVTDETHRLLRRRRKLTGMPTEVFIRKLIDDSMNPFEADTGHCDAFEDEMAAKIAAAPIVPLEKGAD